MSTKTIDDFLAEQYSQSALYQSFRSIASSVDGLKPSSRKVIYTMKKLNIHEPTKVSRLAARVSEETEYLHGETSLEGVIVNLAQNFVGSNNVNLLTPEGNFGTRFVPAAAASRYIFTKSSDDLNRLFNREDDPLLHEQIFEGSVIEPKFFIPVLPVLLINGSEGVGNGYAQKILPRNPEDIKKELMALLKDENYQPKALVPWFRGFKGTVKAEGTGWVIRGRFERINTTKLATTEIPVGETLSGYRAVLDKLMDDKVIKNAEDQSENDNFRFEISCSREFSSQSDEKLYSIFKLERRVTENFTVVDENNTIRVYNSDSQILKDFFNIRKHFYDLRKDNLIKEATDTCNVLFNR